MSWRDKKKVAVGGTPNDAEKRGGTPKKLEVPKQGEGRWEKMGMPKKGRDAGKNGDVEKREGRWKKKWEVEKKGRAPKR